MHLVITIDVSYVNMVVFGTYLKKINRNVKNTQFVSNRKPARNGSYVSIKKYNFCKSFEKLPA